MSTIYASCFETVGGKMRFLFSLPPLFIKGRVLCCFSETDVRCPLCSHCFKWFSCLPILFLTFIHSLTLMIISLLPSTLSLRFSYIWESRLDYSKGSGPCHVVLKLPPWGTSYLYYERFSDLWWIQVPRSVIVGGEDFKFWKRRAPLLSLDHSIPKCSQNEDWMKPEKPQTNKHSLKNRRLFVCESSWKI